MIDVSFATIPAGAIVKPEPYNVHVPDARILAFRSELQHSTIAPVTWESSQTRYGVTNDWLLNAKNVWLHRFDWRKHEERINTYPNFKIHVQDSTSGDIQIHFVALFSQKSNAVPLLFMHGWPGSFMEFLPMLSLLVEKYTPDTLPYHVVVPSLPGFALSSGPPLDSDFTLVDCARIMNKLMINLGFASGYVAQGGDVGSMVARMLSTSHECKAIHVNLLNVSFLDAPRDLQSVTPSEKEAMLRCDEWLKTGNGYLIEHRTRPGTISAVLSSSPLALLAWVGEKFLDWVDTREPLDLEEILASVTLYWYTNTISRNLWPYRSISAFPLNTEKPLGYSYFPRENFFLPRAWGNDLPNFVRYDHERGGHFAALEQPKAFLEDIEDFIANYSGLVKD